MISWTTLQENRERSLKELKKYEEDVPLPKQKLKWKQRLDLPVQKRTKMEREKRKPVNI